MKADIAYKFEKIYGEHADSIFRFCFMRVSAREQALDITQETFLNFWRCLLNQKKIDNDRAFLYTIARHLIIDWYRKKKSLSLDKIMDTQKTFEQDILGEKNKDDAFLPSEGRYVMERINTIAQGYRDVVYLRFIEGMLPQEIGNILGISTNVVSVRINRGLLELKKKLGYTTQENKST